MQRTTTHAFLSARFEQDFARVFTLPSPPDARGPAQAKNEDAIYDDAGLSDALDEHPGDDVLTTVTTR